MVTPSLSLNDVMCKWILACGNHLAQMFCMCFADEDQPAAAGAGTENEPHLQPTVLPDPDAEPGDPPGVAHEGEPEDEGELCASVFRGLVFFLAREVPQEALLLIIRAFGGNAGWQGHGSPFEEGDESITHQVQTRT